MSRSRSLVALLGASLLSTACISKGDTNIGDKENEVDRANHDDDADAGDDSPSSTSDDDEPEPETAPSADDDSADDDSTDDDSADDDSADDDSADDDSADDDSADDDSAEPEPSTPDDDVAVPDCTDNGGCDPLTECSDGPAGPTCSECPAGTTGTGMSGCTPVCDPDPCRNDGVCMEDGNDFLCECPEGLGLSGKRCEIEAFVELAAGGANACGRHASGEVKCWGHEPLVDATPSDEVFTQISVGAGHACGLLEDETVLCWGENIAGETATPEAKFRAISAGDDNTCGIRTDGTLLCWGGPTNTAWIEPPSELGFKQIDVRGAGNGCGITDDDEVVCWGFTGNGVTDTPSGSFREVAAENSAACALTLDGDLTCWGNGTAALLSANAPTPEDGPFRTLELGALHGCALPEPDDLVHCWGLDAAAHPIMAPPNVIKELACAMNFCCGLLNNDEIECWGQDYYGETDHP